MGREQWKQGFSSGIEGMPSGVAAFTMRGKLVVELAVSSKACSSQLCGSLPEPQDR